MKNFRQTCLLIKRIMCKPVMLIILILIPLFLSIVHFLPERRQSTDIVSGFYIETPDSYSATFAKYLTGTSTGFVFRQYNSKEELTDDVSAGRLDSGYVLPSGISESMIKRDNSRSISVFVSPGTSFQEISSEAVYAALLKTYAADMSALMLAETYATDNPGISYDYIHEYISEHFDIYITDNDVFTISSTLSGRYISSEAIIPGTFPVNILIFITVFVCGLLGLQNYLKDLNDGIYSILPQKGRASFCAKNIAAGIIPAAIINIFSMLLYSGYDKVPEVILFIVSSSAAAFIMCILFRIAFRSYKIYMTAMPFIIICTVLLSLLYWLSLK